MIKKLGLLLGSLVFGLLLCEGVLQLIDYPTDDFSPWIADRFTAYRSAPHLNQRMIREEFDVEIKTNEHGFRDDETPEKDGFRILMLGDSYTFGYGAERGGLFTDLLEDHLQTEIINAGVGGFEIIHQLKWFAAEGKDLKADLVVYALYLGNDLAYNDDWLAKEDGGLIHYKKRFSAKTKWASKIKQMLRILYRTGVVPVTKPKEWVPEPDYLAMTKKQLSPESEADYSLAKKLLGGLHAEVTESGTGFFVFLFPYKTVVEPSAKERFQATLPDFENLYDLERPANEMEAFLKDNGIPCFNFVPAMKDYYKNPENPSLFYYSEGHFTSEGNAFVAAQLEPVISSLIKAE